MSSTNRRNLKNDSRKDEKKSLMSTKNHCCQRPRGDDVCEVDVEDEEVFVGKSLTATVTWRGEIFPMIWLGLTSSSSSLSSDEECEVQ